MSEPLCVCEAITMPLVGWLWLGLWLWLWLDGFGSGSGSGSSSGCGCWPPNVVVATIGFTMCLGHWDKN